MCVLAPVDSTPLSLSSSDSNLLAALRERVVVADGAMGTMLQAHDLGLDDFEGHEGCNEILNVTRPDVVALPRGRGHPAPRHGVPHHLT